MFEFTDAFKQNTYNLIRDAISEKEFILGISLLEKFINIDVEEDGFDKKHGRDLNNHSLYDNTWTMKDYQYEAFFRKLGKISGAWSNEKKMGVIYGKIGFYKLLSIPEIKEARKQDPKNEDLQKEFSIANAEERHYEQCPCNFYHYIVAYKNRNYLCHNGAIEESFMTKMKKVAAMYIVFLEQCIKNKEVIEQSFEQQLIESKVDFQKFAMDYLNDEQDFYDNKFLQLPWLNENDEIVHYTEKNCMKFIGEAGVGKTTQMRKIFWDEVFEIMEGKSKRIPIWLDLSDMNGIDGVILEEKIRASLGEYSIFYGVLFEKNLISLYLDGYNEVLMDNREKQESLKKKLAYDIDDIHRKYPKLRICMTDRKQKSNPPCLMDNVEVCHFEGMNEAEIKEYCRKYLLNSTYLDMEQYLASEDAEWLYNEMIIPEKMNILIKLIESKRYPKDENEFYNEYLEFIIEREECEKKETRIGELKYLLYKLANQLESPEDEKKEYDILELWTKSGKIAIVEARRLLDLAKELPILVPGKTRNSYRFKYEQYFYIFLD